MDRRYTGRVELEWDINKAKRNRHDHNVSFNEAVTVFGNSLSITYPDADHSVDEFRFITIGESTSGRMLLISHTERGDRIRIVSAREVTPKERRFYEEER